jgi:hypothetical protein
MPARIYDHDTILDSKDALLFNLRLLRCGVRFRMKKIQLSVVANLTKNIGRILQRPHGTAQGCRF